MRLANIKPNDIVKINVGGRVFYATVTNKGDRELAIDPISPNINRYSAKAPDVVGHWIRAKGSV